MLPLVLSDLSPVTQPLKQRLKSVPPLTNSISSSRMSFAGTISLKFYLVSIVFDFNVILTDSRLSPFVFLTMQNYDFVQTSILHFWVIDGD